VRDYLIELKKRHDSQEEKVFSDCILPELKKRLHSPLIKKRHDSPEEKKYFPGFESSWIWVVVHGLARNLTRWDYLLLELKKTWQSGRKKSFQIIFSPNYKKRHDGREEKTYFPGFDYCSKLTKLMRVLSS
jgi:hypothetical protein